MSFFHFTDGDNASPARWTVAAEFWIYWAVAIPITGITLGLWYTWQNRSRPLRRGALPPSQPQARDAPLYSQWKESLCKFEVESGSMHHPNDASLVRPTGQFS